MPNEEEISVEYDTTGIPIIPTQDSENYYAIKISPYFYTRIHNILNDNDFTNDDISNYNLNVNNNKVDISTTKKLINYLKSLVKKNFSDLNSKIDTNVNQLSSRINEKLDSSDYVIDNQFKINSDNPLSNRVISSKFNDVDTGLNNKSNLNHTHDINDVNALTSTLNSISRTKANESDLSNHVNNKSNPHNVTLADLGLSLELKPVQLFVDSGVSVTVYANSFIVHVVVAGDGRNLSGSSHMMSEKINLKYRPPYSYVTVPATTWFNGGEAWSKISINSEGNVYILNGTGTNSLDNIRTCLTYPKA